MFYPSESEWNSFSREKEKEKKRKEKKRKEPYPETISRHSSSEIEGNKERENKKRRREKNGRNIAFETFSSLNFVLFCERSKEYPVIAWILDWTRKHAWFPPRLLCAGEGCRYPGRNIEEERYFSSRSFWKNC